ncbi:hypothetical protein ISCU110981_07690 [Isoptericola cucumis]
MPSTDERTGGSVDGWTNCGSAATTDTSPHGASAATTSLGAVGTSGDPAPKVRRTSWSRPWSTWGTRVDTGTTPEASVWAGRGRTVSGATQGSSRESPAHRAVRA